MDWSEFGRALASLLVVLGLILMVAYALRRWGERVPGLASLAARRGPGRLEVKEALTLDARHRLVLVRCDDREHLLVLSPDGACQIDTPHAGGAST